jgi:serine/threonine-protein kinase
LTSTVPRRSLASSAGTRRASRSRLPLLTKVALALGAAALVPLGVVPWLLRLNADALSEQVQRTHALAARSSAERVGASLLSLRTAAQTLAASPELRSDPRSDAARALLAGLLQTRPDVAAVAVVAPDGGEVLRAQARAQAEAAGELLALPDGRELLARRRADGGLWVRASAALPEGAGLRVVADARALDALMKPEELGEAADIALFDERGQPLAGPQARAEAFPAALLEAGRSGRLSGAGRYPAPPGAGGGDVLGACAPVPGTRWFVLSRQPAHVAEAAAERMRRRSLLALGAALAIVALLSFGAYRTVILPLREVVQAQRRLIHGAGRVRSRDEIEQLRASFALLEGEARDREAVGHVFLGRYLVVDVIASGGMGTVFRGWDPRLQRPVALKTVRFELAVPGARHGDLVSSLLNEAVTVARLNHPHIVAVYDVEDLPEATFIAMEFVEGQSLADQMSELGSLPARRVVPLGAAIARGLEAAHARQVVHRDVKPANVLLGRDGAIKVTDFGIAGLLSSLAGPANMVFGTPGYLPPEALRGEGQGVPGDLFALGVVLYETLVGDPLYWGGELSVTTRRTMEEPVVPLRERLGGRVPPELDRLVLALLAKRPEARPSSAHEVAAELERLAAREGWEWIMPPPPPGREPRRHESNSCFIPTLPDLDPPSKEGKR